MAIRFTYKPSGVILSSSLSEVTIQADCPFIDVILSSPSGGVLLRERYYAYDDIVTLHDISSLVEAQMRADGLSYADFTLQIYSGSPSSLADSLTYHVLYCDRVSLCTNLPLFLTDNFLTSLSTRRLAPDFTASVSLYAQSGESLAYAFHCCYSTATDDSQHYLHIKFNDGVTASMDGVVQINISPSDIISAAASAAGYSVSQVCLQSFAVCCGARSASFIIDRTLAHLDSFFFRNCFNIIELACLPMVTTTKTNVEQSTAIVFGHKSLYDRSAEVAHEVIAGPLSAEEADWIDRLFTSYEVYRLEANNYDDTEPAVMYPVIISECSCEISDSDEKPNTVKFTWLHTDVRPLLHLDPSPGIFTSQFDYRFS